MKFKLEFDCDNAAFGDYPEDEIVRILKVTARKIEENGIGSRLRILDLNGNSVGFATYEE